LVAGAGERRAEIDGLSADAVDLPQLLEGDGVAGGSASKLAHLGRSRARRSRCRSRDQGNRGEAG
jgi:hypothetical protein